LTTLPRFVGTRFQVLFHSPPGVLFTFPSRYWSAIGHQGVFRLSRWSCQIHTGFLGPRATWDTPSPSARRFVYRGITCYAGPFQTLQLRHTFMTGRGSGSYLHEVPRPRPCNAYRLSHMARFSLFRFRSPLLTESRLLSLPVGTEMFHFPTFPPLVLCVQTRVTGHDSSRVSPFGNPRITARLPASRGLSQASTSFFGS
jgi:hypothetical protein